MLQHRKVSNMHVKQSCLWLSILKVESSEWLFNGFLAVRPLMICNFANLSGKPQKKKAKNDEFLCTGCTLMFIPLSQKLPLSGRRLKCCAVRWCISTQLGCSFSSQCTTSMEHWRSGRIYVPTQNALPLKTAFAFSRTCILLNMKSLYAFSPHQHIRRERWMILLLSYSMKEKRLWLDFITKCFSSISLVSKE